MKLVKKILTYLPALIFLFSCQNSELDVSLHQENLTGIQKELREVIITAQSEDPAPLTRTETEVEVSGSGTKSFPMYWLPGDKMMVYSAGEASEFTSINTTRTRVAKFKGVISVISGADDGTEKDYVWAIYPSSAAVGYSEPNGNSATAVLTADFPAIQASKAGSYADDIAMTIGRSESLGVYFKSVYSCLYFTFARNDIASITLRGRNNETLAGRVNVTLVNNEPVATPVTGYESKKVTMNAPDGGAFVPGQEYYMVFLPQTFAQGISLTLRRTDGQEGTFELRNQNLKLGRNVFTSLATPDSRIESQANINNGTSTGWHDPVFLETNEIWYKSVDNVEIPYAQGQDATVNQLVANIPPSADNDNWGIMRFAAPVTETDYRGFNGAQSLLSVKLPVTLETINTESFVNCLRLETVEIGPNLKTIKGRAFMSCSGLKNIHIPESVTSIGSLEDKDYLLTPFYQCPSLESFSGKYASSDGRSLVVDGLLLSFAPGGMRDATYFVPSDVQHIGHNAFFQADFSGIVLPEGLITIQDFAFAYNSRLKSVTIPSTVEALYYGAFQRCSGLDRIEIKRADHVLDLRQSDPHSYYSYNVFFETNNCPIYVPNNLLESYTNGEPWDAYGSLCETGNRYFSAQQPNEIWYTTTDGTTLSFTPAQEEQFGIASYSDYGRIIFENDITEIPESFLENNTKLKTISLPDGVKHVMNYAFRYCSNLEDVSFGNQLQKIHAGAFSYCDLQSLVLPEGLTEIQSVSFEGNTSLQSVRFPSSLVLVSSMNAFEGCTSLTSFSGVSGASNPMWSISSDGRCLIDLSVSTYVQGVGRVTSPMLCSFATAGLDGQHYVLPDGITMISNGAMRKCTLKSIQLPATVTKIFDWAFGECTQLTNINIPPSVTYIGAYAFYGCSQLTNTNIPAGVTSLEPYTFYGCENLRQIGMDGAIPPTLGSNVFKNTNDTFVIAIPGAGDGKYHDSVNYPDWYALRDHFRIYQPNNEIWFHLVGDEASHLVFGGTGDFDVNLVDRREIYATRDKLGPLVPIPTELETGNDDEYSIAVYVFDDKITNVPAQAFSTELWNSKLDWLSLPGIVTEIGQGAFAGNSHLLVFPLYADYVLTSIGADAFNGCSSMKYNHNLSTNISVFQPVTTIGDRAFRNCSSMQSFSAPGVTSLGEQAFYSCEGLNHVTLSSLTVVKDETFNRCKALETILTGELSSIGKKAFSSCDALKDVGTNIDDGIIQLPNITSLPEYAFYRCIMVEAIRLPNLTAAYENAFGELGTATSLHELYVPKLARVTGLYVFGGIIMDDLNLPSVTSIPMLTFGYSKIKTIRFGSSLSYFGGNNKTDLVFNSIVELPERHLYFEGTTPPSFGTYAFYTDYNVCEVLLPLTSIHVPAGCKEAYKTALHNANSAYDAYFDVIVEGI